MFGSLHDGAKRVCERKSSFQYQLSDNDSSFVTINHGLRSFGEEADASYVIDSDFFQLEEQDTDVNRVEPHFANSIDERGTCSTGHWTSDLSQRWSELERGSVGSYHVAETSGALGRLTAEFAKPSASVDLLLTDIHSWATEILPSVSDFTEVTSIANLPRKLSWVVYAQSLVAYSITRICTQRRSRGIRIINDSLFLIR